MGRGGGVTVDVETNVGNSLGVTALQNIEKKYRIVWWSLQVKKKASLPVYVKKGGRCVLYTYGRRKKKVNDRSVERQKGKKKKKKKKSEKPTGARDTRHETNRISPCDQVSNPE